MKFIYIKFIIIFLLFANLKANDNLLDTIGKNKDYSNFYELIKIANFEKLFSQDYKFKKIIYLPDNKAFEAVPEKLKELIWSQDNNKLAKKIVRSHLYSDSIKSVFNDPRKKVTVIQGFEINNEMVRIYSNSDLFVKDMVEEGKIIDNEKYTIVPVACVMFIQPSYTDDRLTNIQKDSSLITSCCLLSDEEVIDITEEYNF